VNGETAWTAAARVLLVTAVMALVEIDILARRLPREISYPTAVISFVLLGVGRPEQVWSMLLGALLPMSVLAVTSWCSRRQLGSGDVRMWPLCGVHLGAESMATVTSGFVSSFVIAGVVVIGLVVSGRAGRSSTIPFGPFLAAGSLLALSVAPSIG
jgi:leader peptidase (prepilin peptidase)/N-methyltransferase